MFRCQIVRYEVNIHGPTRDKLQSDIPTFFLIIVHFQRKLKQSPKLHFTNIRVLSSSVNAIFESIFAVIIFKDVHTRLVDVKSTYVKFFYF